MVTASPVFGAVIYTLYTFAVVLVGFTIIIAIITNAYDVVSQRQLEEGVISHVLHYFQNRGYRVFTHVESETEPLRVDVHKLRDEVQSLRQALSCVQASGDDENVEIADSPELNDLDDMITARTSATSDASNILPANESEPGSSGIGARVLQV